MDRVTLLEKRINQAIARIASAEKRCKELEGEVVFLKKENEKIIHENRFHRTERAQMSSRIERILKKVANAR